MYQAPFHIDVGGITTLGPGLPFNITTGTTNSGDTGATTDGPVINGVVIARNAGRGRPIYDFSPFIERQFALGTERVLLAVRAEAFNALNHATLLFTGTIPHGICWSGVGQPLAGVTNQLPARSMQFSARLTF